MSVKSLIGYFKNW